MVTGLGPLKTSSTRVLKCGEPYPQNFESLLIFKPSQSTKSWSLYGCGTEDGFGDQQGGNTSSGCYFETARQQHLERYIPPKDSTAKMGNGLVATNEATVWHMAIVLGNSVSATMQLVLMDTTEQHGW